MTLNELIAAVPVHDHKGRAYFVVLDEIPQPWAEQFLDALYGSACPVIDGFGPCAYAWDWDLWVRGGWRGECHGPHPIENEADYRAALKVVSVLIDADPKLGTPDGDRLKVLGTLVEVYEASQADIPNVRGELSGEIERAAHCLAAKTHLAAGRAIYYGDPLYPGQIVKEYPDGRRQLVDIDEKSVVTVIKEISSRIDS